MLCNHSFQNLMDKSDPEYFDAAARLKRLVDSAVSTKVSDSVPLERYYRSMLQLDKMAHGYLIDKDYEKALVLLLRFCSFVMEEIPKHAQHKSYNGTAKQDALLLLKPNLEKAEDVKRILRIVYEKKANERIRLLEHHREESAKTNAEINHLIATEERKDLAVVSIPRDDGNSRNREHAGAAVNSEVTRDLSYEQSLPESNAYSAAGALVAEAEVQFHGGGSSSSTVAVADKTLAIASNLPEKFLEYSSVNTSLNVETCGILCGKSVCGRFIISHIIMPKQQGSANGCYAEGEAEVFEVQRQHDLLTFGWIHTHPSQTAFLSSIDLHTHHAYQSAMSEAIAIVCAPTHNQIGVYVLTTEGMNIVGRCTLKGFHPHPDTVGVIYKDAPHVVYTSALGATIIDLRNT